MEGLAALLRAIAWPVVVLVIFFVLRKKLGDLLDRLKRINVRGTEAEFREKLSRAEDVADALRPQGPRPGAIEERTTEWYGRYETLLTNIAKTSPRAAIIETWVLIERSLRATAERELGEQPKRRWLMPAVRALVAKTGLPSSFLTLIPNMNNLRNEAVHERGVDIGPSDAEAYIDIALSILESLDFAGLDAR